MSPQSPPSDTVRYAQKLWRYLPTLDVISKALQTRQTQGITDELDFYRILQEVLPGLKRAFNSEIAFCADVKGEIHVAEPEDSAWVGKVLPSTKRVRRLLEVGEPIVIVSSEGAYPELNTLGVQSLLVVRLLIPWGGYLVGVCNGQDDPVYEGVDKKLFRTWADIFQVGLNYGYIRTETETRLAYERYLDAQLRGEYSLLHRDGEDYAKRLLKLKGDTSTVRIDTRFDADDVYADYLEAALSMKIRNEPKSKRVNRGVITNKGEGPKLSSLSLCIELFEQLSPIQYPQTALAKARIYLWAYIKDRPWASSGVGKQKRDLNFQQKDSKELKTADNSYMSFRQLLKEIEENKIQVEELPPLQSFVDWLRTPLEALETPGKDFPDIQLYIDWLRTHWQKIHYFACNGISEPRSEWIREIVDTYTHVRPVTVWVLQTYLYAHERKEGLRVDSDWLTIWFISNVLMSQRLAEYYGLDAKGESMASLAEEMNYFAHFSHLVLYTLHCARHLHREKEIQEELRSEDLKIPRLPFVTVAGDLSPSLSETQLYMLSEYAYREIGVHRELLLLERLTRQLRYELPLYAASEFYRDHLYHVIDVCLLGELLLRSQVLSCTHADSSLTLIESFDVGTAHEQVQLLMKNWYVAALCHDLGYVVERAQNLLEPVHAINGPGLNEFWKAVEAGLKDGSDEISRTVKLKLPYSANGTGLINDLKKVEATDHGLVGWLHLNHWLDQVKVPSDKMIHALNAIVRHNLPEQRVNCRYEPLTLLLMLCDHLQEWGRPRVGPDPLARSVMELLRFSEQPNFEQKVRVEYLVIKGIKTAPPEQCGLNPKICKECWATKNCQEHCLRLQTRVEKEEGLTFELPYIEARQGDFEPSISWLLMCRDLQCFGGQDKDLPFNIKIKMEYIPSRIWEKFPWKPLEMDLLQEFASSYEPATYLCEWIEKARRGDEGIQYAKDLVQGIETFTIHLNKLNRPLSRGLASEHWRPFSQWKWQRLEHQFVKELGVWFPDL